LFLRESSRCAGVGGYADDRRGAWKPFESIRWAQMRQPL
jgi:hypothetical protein